MSGAGSMRREAALEHPCDRDFGSHRSGEG